MEGGQSSSLRAPAPSRRSHLRASSVCTWCPGVVINSILFILKLVLASITISKIILLPPLLGLSHLLSERAGGIRRLVHHGTHGWSVAGTHPLWWAEYATLQKLRTPRFPDLGALIPGSAPRVCQLWPSAVSCIIASCLGVCLPLGRSTAQPFSNDEGRN